MKREDRNIIDSMYNSLSTQVRERVDQVVDKIVSAKQKGEKIAVVTGSGPNIHEGVSTLIAELIEKKIIDGVITSSAVVAHEMAGSLDRVKRVSGASLDMDKDFLPRGGVFEITLLDEAVLDSLKKEMIIDTALIERVKKAKGDVIIKAAGNMAYPVGLRTERVAMEVEALSRMAGRPFELIAGLGADRRTMLGAGAANGVPVVVSVPQLVGGGMVGLAVSDSIPVKQRSRIVAEILSEASVIIESGIALSQEIHDGPFETYTGHGIWTAWDGGFTYSLEGRTLVRIDLDANLRKVWEMEREEGGVQEKVDRGLPKTKTLKVPFRMEMSGFARLEGSIPVVGDIGVIWPIIAVRVSDALSTELDFISFPQESGKGKEMRDWIVDTVAILDLQKMRNGVRKWRSRFAADPWRDTSPRDTSPRDTSPRDTSPRDTSPRDWISNSNLFEVT